MAIADTPREEPGPPGPAPPAETTVPPELERFLEQPTPQSLVIRGAPGAGKTTLALTLLARFAGRRLFLTRRVQRDKLLLDFPWLGEHRRDVDVFDEDRSEDVRSNARTVALLRLRERASADHASNGFGDLGWIPPPLRRAWEPNGPAGPSLVVIDSWDALVEDYLGLPPAPDERLPDRAELERLLLRHLAQSRARLVLVVEREAPTQLDYLVDGVVTASRTRFEDRVDRWLTLDKLRGVELRDSDYPFTLKEGRFECFPAFEVRRADLVPRAEPDPAPVPGALWPGAAAFVEAFGRLSLERLTLLQLDSSVADEVGELLVLPMAAHVLRAGGRFVFVPPVTVLGAEVARTYAPAAEADGRDQLRILTASEIRTEDAERWGPVLVPLSADPTPSPPGGNPPAAGAPAPGPALPEVFEFLHASRRPGVPNLGVGFLSSIAPVFEAASPGARGGPLPLVLLRYLAGAPAHAVLVARTGDPLLGALSRAAALHLQVAERHGHLVLFGHRPWTAGFAVTFAPAPIGAGAPYGLVPIV